MLDVWGQEAQVLKLCEEMGELSQAIVKHIQKGRWRKRVLQEVSDVELMLGLMKHMLGLTQKELLKYKTAKVKRIWMRLNKKEK